MLATNVSGIVVCIFLIALRILSPSVGFVQGAGGQSSPGKFVAVVRTDTAPMIDGRVSKGEWIDAAVVEDLHQVRPVEGAAPSERTEIYVTYDSAALYVGARMYERNPELIANHVLKQNSNMAPDDVFAVILDTFHDRRNGYVFRVNANGVRREAIFEDVTDRNFDWDGIWQAQATIDDEGWFAEMRIPFKTLSFDPESTVWGINFERRIRRRNELIAWSSNNQSVDPSASEDLLGFENLDQGMGLDIVPSVSVREERHFDIGQEEVKLEPSLDIFYRVTPALTAAMTINTDFSATEVDDRQINLSRFSLFSPEKRAFFLEGADIFEFGRLAGNRRSELSQAAQQNGRPFFSRQIGLSASGQLVDILGGVKLTGRIGPWNIGFLDVQQDAFGAVDEKNLLVGRAALNVLEESSVGAIITSGSPRSNLDHKLGGVDFRYRNTRLPGDNVLEAEAWYQRSDTEGIADSQDAYGMGLRLPNSVAVRARFGIKVLQENFNPALGFVNRRGIRAQTAELAYKHMMGEGLIQSLNTGIEAKRIEELDGGGLQSERIMLRLLELENEASDRIEFRALLNTETLRPHRVLARS